MHLCCNIITQAIVFNFIVFYIYSTDIHCILHKNSTKWMIYRSLWNKIFNILKSIFLHFTLLFVGVMYITYLHTQFIYVCMCVCLCVGVCISWELKIDFRYIFWCITNTSTHICTKKKLGKLSLTTTTNGVSVYNAIQCV